MTDTGFLDMRYLLGRSSSSNAASEVLQLRLSLPRPGLALAMRARRSRVFKPGLFYSSLPLKKCTTMLSTTTPIVLGTHRTQ